eukprot:gene7288-32484_t
MPADDAAGCSLPMFIRPPTGGPVCVEVPADGTVGDMRHAAAAAGLGWAATGLFSFGG